MSTEIYLPRQYLPQVPESATVNTGEQGEIEVIRDEFFEKVLDYLGIVKSGRRVAEVSTHALSLEDYSKSFMGTMSTGKAHFHRRIENDEQAREDYVTILKIDEIPVASCLMLRDMGNYVQGVFSHHLTTQWEKKIRRVLHSHSNNNITYLDDPFHNFR